MQFSVIFVFSIICNFNVHVDLRIRAFVIFFIKNIILYHEHFLSYCIYQELH